MLECLIWGVAISGADLIFIFFFKSSDEFWLEMKAEFPIISERSLNMLLLVCAMHLCNAIHLK